LVGDVESFDGGAFNAGVVVVEYIDTEDGDLREEVTDLDWGAADGETSMD
jgi:hypothetical protein